MLGSMSDNIVATVTSNRTSHTDLLRPYLWVLILIVLALMVVAVAVLGSRTSSGDIIVNSPEATAEREARIYTISYRFGVFSPTNLRIHNGDTVRFRNDSSSAIHIIAQKQPNEKTPEFDSIGPVAPGSYFSYTFARIGVFGYYNVDNKNEAGVIMVR